MTYQVTKFVRGAHRMIVKGFDDLEAAKADAVRWAKSNSSGDYIAKVEFPDGRYFRYEGNAGYLSGYRVTEGRKV